MDRLSIYLGWKTLQRRGRRLAGASLLLCAAALTGCYEPDPIDELIVSPDGRWVALHSQSGEINLIDLRQEGPMRLLSRDGEPGLAFSPDSSRLAMLQHAANAAPTLWLVDTLTAEGTTLTTDSAWKGSPVWLSDDELAFRSDADSDDINILALDRHTLQTRTLLDRSGDVSGLWSGGAAGSLVYRADTAQRSDLWLWTPGTEPQRIASDPIAALPEGRFVAARGDGGLLVFQREAPEGSDVAREVVGLDPATLEEKFARALPAPLSGLALLNNGKIAIGQGDRILVWWPEAPWYRGEASTTQWRGAPLGVSGPFGERGLVVVANQNLVLMAETPGELEGGHLYSRRTEDLARLAYVRTRAGDPRGARSMLREIWDSSDPKERHQRFVLALGLGRLERSLGRWSAADEWLLEAITQSEPDSIEHDAVLGERLAVAAFDARDVELARGVLEDVSPDRVQIAAELAELGDVADAGQYAEWMRIAGRVRAGEYQRAAQEIRRAAEDPRQTTTSLVGVRMVSSMGLEPLGLTFDLEEGHLRGLMAEPEFQAAILQLLHTPGDTVHLPDDLRSRMALQWARQGNYQAGRVLVEQSLAEDPEAAESYIDNLHQFLGIEDTDAAMDAHVRRVLLAEPARKAITAALEDSTQHLWLRLALTKAQIIEGDVDLAQSTLDSARGLLAGAPEGVEAARDDADLAQQLFYIALFQAKIHERNRSWSQAAAAYRQCLAVMDAAPGYWDVAPQEILFSLGLVEMGPHDPDTVTSFQRVLRGMGDPLINPAHDLETIEATLSNLRTMLGYSAGAWIEPYLRFGIGLCHSQAQRRPQALHALAEARALNPPGSLQQRILMEEGAIRDTQGQHALASRLYMRVVGLDLPLPVLAIALLNAQQSQQACGMLENPTRSFADQMQALDLPRHWRDWLWLQVGTGEDS